MQQARNLLDSKTAPLLDESRPSLPAIDPITRPSSTVSQTSSQHLSASLTQLPGLSALASLASGRESPILRPFLNGPRDDVSQTYQSPSASVGGIIGGAAPTCANCSTSTTPLWRRDELGSVLCNACGLFLKLHGRPRPISLKTDVIKSRNRVKTSGPGGSVQKKKMLFDNANGFGDGSQGGTPNGMAHRRTSHKSQNGHSEGSLSPSSRNGTPSMYHGLQAFDGSALNEHQFQQGSPSLLHQHLRGTSPGRSESSMNGANQDGPQTYEQLMASNSSLKTRVSELEVINELFRGRVTQLEQDEANARRGEEMRRESEDRVRQLLEESQRRENQLKRRLDDVERDLAEATGAPHKKIRLTDIVVESETSTPELKLDQTSFTDPTLEYPAPEEPSVTSLDHSNLDPSLEL